MGKLELAASLARAMSSDAPLDKDKATNMKKRRSIRGSMSVPAAPTPKSSERRAMFQCTAPLDSEIEVQSVPPRVEISSLFSDERRFERRRGRAEGFVIGVVAALSSIALGCLALRRR